MSHLSDEDIGALQQRLALMRKQALDEIKTANAEIESARASKHGEAGSRSDDVEITRFEEIRRSEMEIDLGTLRKIEEAEHRIIKGCYGVCSDCGEPIARERLLALPVATRCATCEKKKETQSVR